VHRPSADGDHVSEATPAFLMAFSTVRETLMEVVQQAPKIDGPHNMVSMNRQTYALVFGLASGLSLPLGALLGVKFSPVADRDVAAMMAFGAGCLLFAVTVELYAHALAELEHGRIGYPEMVCQTSAALLGAYFYVWTNRWLTESFEEHGNRKKEEVEGPFSPEAYRQVMELQQDREKLWPFSQPMQDGRMSSLVSTSPRNLDPKQRAKQMWKQIRMTFHLRRFVDYWQKEAFSISGLRGREKGLRVLANEFVISKKPSQRICATEQTPSPEAKRAKKVALALFLGLLIDGVPEGVLMGFLAAEGHLSLVLIISLLVANFPEAFSSASLLVTAGMSLPSIVALWTSLAILVGCLSGLSCSLLLWAYPNFGQSGEELPYGMLMTISGVEGLTGGAMIACIASVMLPEAFERAGKDGPLSFSSGFLTTAGFLVATALKTVGG